MIIYYKNKSDDNVVGKELEEVRRENIVLKKTIDFTTPTLELKIDVVDFDYIRLEQLDRYYFIRSIESLGGYMYLVHLECDVLETYKDIILNSDSIYRKQLQGYQNVNQLSDVRKEYEIFKSDVTLEKNKDDFVISVMNGGY